MSSSLPPSNSNSEQEDGAAAQHATPAPAAIDDDDDTCVRSGDWVVLESTDGKRVLGHVVPNGTARVAKRKRPLSALLGAQWGDEFAVSPTGGLAPARPTRPRPALPPPTGAPDPRDNRDLVDRDCNQALTQAEIEELKAGGASGADLVRAAVANSSTFAGKTAFAQEKYVARKRAKYELRVRVVRPTAARLCGVYFARAPVKVLGMRADALAFLLAYSGVRAGCRAIVSEDCTGLVTAACAERMGGRGELLNVFEGATPSGTEALKMTNAGPLLWATVVHTPLEVFARVDEKEPCDAERLRYGTDAWPLGEVRTEFATGEVRARTLARRPLRSALKRSIRAGADALVVAVRGDVLPRVDVLLRHVACGGAFAVYGAYFQPMAELQFALQLSRMAVRVELVECGLVQHQMLPGRSHPMMSDSAAGGYVLWGVRVEVSPP